MTPPTYIAADGAAQPIRPRGLVTHDMGAPIGNHACPAVVLAGPAAGGAASRPGDYSDTGPHALSPVSCQPDQPTIATPDRPGPQSGVSTAGSCGMPSRAGAFGRGEGGNGGTATPAGSDIPGTISAATPQPITVELRSGDLPGGHSPAMAALAPRAVPPARGAFSGGPEWL